MNWFGRRSERAVRNGSPDDRARWNAWRDEVFGDGYLVWHEGADTDASTARWRRDPEGTATALVLGLAADDHVAAEAVEAFARSGGAPGPDVTAAVVAASASDRPPTVRVAAAMAAYCVTGDPAFVGVLVEVLLHRGVTDRHGFEASPRATAARLLAGVPATRQVADALADAVAHDPDYLVRYPAVQSLLTFAGADPQLRQPTVETLSERGTPAGRAALARDLRRRVPTVD